MPNNSVEKALGVDICESGVMQNAIELWHNMYKNEPPWRGGKDNVIPLNLPAAISEEFARLILTEFSMEVTGSPMAAFINEQLKDQLTDLNKFVEQYSQQMYNGKWKTVIEINLTDDVPDEIELPEQKGQMYWYETWRDLRIVTKAPKEKKKLTKEELAKKEQDRKSKEVKEILKGSAARRKDFISGIISGKIPALKDENAAREKIWEALVLIGYGLYGSIARGFFLEDDEWKYSEEERK